MWVNTFSGQAQAVMTSLGRRYLTRLHLKLQCNPPYTPLASRSRCQFYTRHTFRTSQTRSSTSSAVSTATKTWVDCLPSQVRPYLYLTRIDKPIGTLLLFYPCGLSNSPFSGPTSSEGSLSVVNHHGFIHPRTSLYHAVDLYWLIWSRSPCYAWCRMYHQ